MSKKALRRGAAVLRRSDDHAPPKTAHWILRTYYTSRGGEKLAYDAGPLRMDRVDSMCSELGWSASSRSYTRRTSYCFLYRWKQYDKKPCEYECQGIHVRHENADAPEDSCRLVCLPSQEEIK